MGIGLRALSPGRGLLEPLDFGGTPTATHVLSSAGWMRTWRSPVRRRGRRENILGAEVHHGRRRRADGDDAPLPRGSRMRVGFKPL